MGSHLLVQEWRVLFLLNSTFPWPELGRAAMKIRGCNDRSFVNNLICISTRLYHTYHHIYHGPGVILPWYLLMVCHSEYCSQYFPSLHPRITYFDSLMRDLLYVYRNRSTPSYWPQQIWKSDTSPKYWSARFRMLSLCRRIWSIYFPLTIILSSSCFGDGYWEAYATGSCIIYESGWSRIQGRILPRPDGSEAERRITFFWQSLTTHNPVSLPADACQRSLCWAPITLKKKKRILLSLRENIEEEDQHTRVTFLEYLMQLHPI